MFFFEKDVDALSYLFLSVVMSLSFCGLVITVIFYRPKETRENNRILTQEELSAWATEFLKNNPKIDRS